jgi:hypothetical protein
MHWSRRPLVMGLVTVSLALVVGACGSDDDSSDGMTTGAQPPPGGAGSSLPQGGEPANLDPAEFTTEIENPYWPLRPGARWVYREVENGEVQRVEVTVTNRTKRIANGVTARVVRDVVTLGGEPTEITDDWYAQDSAGNVWYLGEDTAEYENGKVVSRAGAWEAGVGGADAGVIMPANPEVGMKYRQEYDPGNAEDKGSVVSLDATAKVPFGSFDHVLKTRDVNPLEKNVVEFKFYARGVGPVETIQTSGGEAHEVLLSYRR